MCGRSRSSLYLRVVLLLAAIGGIAPAALNAQGPIQASPEVRALLDQGRAAEGQGRREEARAVYNRALDLSRERKDRPGEAAALIRLAASVVYQKPQETQALGEQALAILREVGDRFTQAACLRLLGNAAQISSQPQQALARYEEAGRISQELGDKLGYAFALSNTATVYIRTGQPHRAIEYLLRSLPIDEEAGRKDNLAQTYGNLGAAYRNARDLPHALEYLEKALALTREAGARHDEGIVLLNLGLAHARMTGPARALECYDQALPLLEAASDNRTIAAVLTSRAEAYEAAGDLFKSLESAQRALGIHRQVGDRNGIGRSLSNLAGLYYRVGQPAVSLRLYQEALPASREASDLLAQMTILTEMGQLYGKSGQRRQEQESYAESLRLHEKNDSYVDARASTLLHLAVSLMRSGKRAEALARSEEARDLYRKASDVQGEADAELRVGEVRERMGQAAEAQARYERAVQLFHDLGSGPGEAAAAGALGALEEGRQHYPEAARHYARALALLEQSRASLGGLAEAKSGYLERQVPVYQGYIRTLLQTRQSALAFEWAQKAKGRALVDLMESGKVDVSAAMTEADRKQEQDLQRREKVLSQKSQAAAALLEYLQRQPQTDRARQEQAKTQAGEIRRQQQQVERDWRTFQDQLYVRNPRLAQQRAARVATLEQAAALLPPDTALLEYCQLTDPRAGERDQVALFVVTRAKGRPRLNVFRILPPSGSLQRMAGELRQACAGRPGSPAARPYQGVSRELHRLLLGPAGAVLAGKRRLIVCPDGPLWEVPFHALLGAAAKSGTAGSFLWERFAIGYSYSATAIRAALEVRTRPDRPRAERSLLVIASPALDPATPSPAEGEAPRGLFLRAGGLSALPSTRTEARAIAATFPEATVKMEEEAQELLVKQTGPTYRRLHFATHALLNDAAPMLSGIVLARPPKDSPEDGILTARELFGLSLAADTVVLSACDTARGATRRGEGVIGLTWAIFVAGSPAQVVSQWAVDDRATSELMGGFYRRLKKGQGREVALRGSALTLLRDGRHQHPFYWAPFVLMGDWR